MAEKIFLNRLDTSARARAFKKKKEKWLFIMTKEKKQVGVETVNAILRVCVGSYRIFFFEKWSIISFSFLRGVWLRR